MRIPPATVCPWAARRPCRRTATAPADTAARISNLRVRTITPPPDLPGVGAGPVHMVTLNWLSESRYGLRYEHRALPVLLALPAAGHASGLVDGQCRGHQQEQKGGGGVKSWGWVPEPVKLITGQGRLSRNVAQVVKGLHVEQQDDGGDEVDHELEQDPVVSEQAPGAAQGADQPGRQGGQAQGDEREPAGQLHYQIGALDRLGVLA